MFFSVPSGKGRFESLGAWGIGLDGIPKFMGCSLVLLEANQVVVRGLIEIKPEQSGYVCDRVANIEEVLSRPRS
jgi:hypothetical protein